MSYSPTYPNYVILDLYKRLLALIRKRDQWNQPRAGKEWMKNACEYQCKADALLEILENVTVFHVGGGLNRQFCINFDDRVKSFEKLLLLEEKKS